MSYWLLKTEPEEYSWTDLIRENETVWDGVRAPAAVKNIQQLKPGDLAFIYHTGPERAVVGTARIATGPMWNGNRREWVFRVAAVEKLSRPVTLQEIKNSGRFSDWDLVRLPRLSVVPVNREQWEAVMDWSRA